ncbi:uncharacterized protein B0H18DRAFT_252473 [Fomitopsis serialis]|uniref:uncharacterized protein n=1 Tax=Fomitopsis serialis TaxID=139415 RepID=UPI002007E6B4|nr:uncharacterized protein B0H18DRAFT_252473 [Neoantrodia serialis]KAH9928257.1 hypothetical protein B0H18DRAFT_252473 [Neoantrodia serialis]
MPTCTKEGQTRCSSRVVARMQQPLCQQTTVLNFHVMKLSHSEITELTALLSSIQDPNPSIASLLRRLSTQRDNSNDTDCNAVQSIGVASQEAVHTAHGIENQISHVVQVDESTSSVHASVSGSGHTQIEQLIVGNQPSYSVTTVPDPGRHTTGPIRPPRSRRKLVSALYDRTSGPTENGQQNQVAQFPLGPCIQWVASEKQPHTAWDMASKPYEVASTPVVNFFNTLTACNVKDDVARSARLTLLPFQASHGERSETLSQLAQRCTEMDHKQGLFDFRLMIALIRFAFECASLSGWTDVNISALWREQLSIQAKPPS